MNYCKDCGKKTKEFGKRCHSCAGQYRLKDPRNHPAYIDGRTDTVGLCLDCGKEIDYRSKRCKPCVGKIKSINQQGKNNPSYKDGRYSNDIKKYKKEQDKHQKPKNE